MKAAFSRLLRIFFLQLACLAFFSCSSAPKRVMLVTDITNVAYAQLDEANKRIVEENYTRAYKLLTEAYRRALSVDNTELLCKISLSGVVLKISCPEFQDELTESNPAEETFKTSFLESPVGKIMEQAQKFARRANDSERKLLEQLCAVYEVRMLLEDETASSSSQPPVQNASSYLSKLDAVKKAVSKEPYYHAYLWRTRGDVCMAAGRYLEAQKSFAEAAKIHTKERYLIEIGLDWYCVARSCSMAGKKREALSAIQTALKYDKDAENTTGIASDYKAYSKILLKGNPSEDDKKLSEELARWAEKILATRI